MADSVSLSDCPQIITRAFEIGLIDRLFAMTGTQCVGRRPNHVPIVLQSKVNVLVHRGVIWITQIDEGAHRSRQPDEVIVRLL